jgi:hypothetical protein
MNRRGGLMVLAGLLATGGATVAIAMPDPSPEPPETRPKPGRPLTVPGTPRDIEPPPYEPAPNETPPYEPPYDPPYEGAPERPGEPVQPVQPIAPAAPDPDIDRMLDRQLDDIIRDNADRAIGNSEGWSP